MEYNCETGKNQLRLVKYLPSVATEPKLAKGD